MDTVLDPLAQALWWQTDWILPNGLSSLQMDPAFAALPGHVADLSYDERQLGAGLSLYTFVARIHEPVTMSYRFLLERPYFWISQTMSGTGSYQSGPSLEGQYAPDKSYFAMLRDDVTTLTSSPGTQCGSGIILTHAHLAGLLEGERVKGRIKDLLDGGFDPAIVQFTSTDAIRSITGQMFSHPFRGAMEAVYLQAKAHELLVETLRLLTDDAVSAGVSRARRYAMAAREIMLSDIGNPPSIGEVARRVGLSQRALGEVCQEVFGASALQCFTRWRLEMARQFLASGDYSIKQVAHLTGYAYVSNFSQAFTRQFGHPPSSFLRR